ncbi:hypothetical protein AVEN_158680-1 [Araneus ventricosus]|uniref:Uncharacterized protein n=1 Tax=Araneus ventricosus TaxID=182803 RepID=A0A4Y2RGQ6_ARAVE|nr:hypothetical protein AVEN_158680-1 [Araneus ventricosus]
MLFLAFNSSLKLYFHCSRKSEASAECRQIPVLAREQVFACEQRRRQGLLHHHEDTQEVKLLEQRQEKAVKLVQIQEKVRNSIQWIFIQPPGHKTECDDGLGAISLSHKSKKPEVEEEVCRWESVWKSGSLPFVIAGRKGAVRKS